MISVEEDAGVYSLLNFLTPKIRKLASDLLGNEVELNTTVLAEIDVDALVDIHQRC